MPDYILEPEHAYSILQEFGYDSFTKLQKKALTNCRYKGGAREFIIGTTSAGKTLVPLLCYQFYRKEMSYPPRMLYLIPYRALAVQKMKSLQKYFQGLRILLSTSEYNDSDEDIQNGYCDIAVIIYEKAFLFTSRYKNFFSQYNYIVFDEIGIVENIERGLKVDYLLKQACKIKENNIFILASPYYKWDAYIDKYEFVKKMELARPVDIEMHKLVYETDDSRDANIVKICQEHLKQSHKILIFFNGRDRVRDFSRYIYKNIFSTEEDKESLSIIKQDFSKRLMMAEDDFYTFMEDEDFGAYSCGIAYHNASLPEEMRELIEEDFLLGNKLKIVISTETLAYGLNSNVDVVIVADMLKPNGKAKRFLTLNEYENYVGRAGRLGSRPLGYAYTFITTKQEKGWIHLQDLKTSPPAINSQYRNIINRKEVAFHLLNYIPKNRSEGLATAEKLKQEIESYPFKDNEVGLEYIEDILAKMESRKFIKAVENEFYGEMGYTLSQAGAQILGIVISLESYDKLFEAGKRILQKQIPFVYDYLYTICGCEEMTQKRRYTYSECNEMVFHCVDFLNKLVTEGKASSNCRNEIIKNKNIRVFMHHLIFSEKKFDWAYLNRLILTEALYCWINGYHMTDISRNLIISYGDLKTKGEKAKYITDVIICSIGNLEGTNAELLSRIGVSLYYGIRLDILESLNKFTVTPEKGRQLRIVSIIKRLTEENNTKSRNSIHRLIKKYSDRLDEEYKQLLELVCKSEVYP